MSIEKALLQQILMHPKKSTINQMDNIYNFQHSRNHNQHNRNNIGGSNSNNNDDTVIGNCYLEPATPAASLLITTNFEKLVILHSYLCCLIKRDHLIHLEVVS